MIIFCQINSGLVKRRYGRDILFWIVSKIDQVAGMIAGGHKDAITNSGSGYGGNW